jgi:hypothetical protein
MTLVRLARDPVAFVEEVLVNPESGQRFELYDAQRVFLREALTPTPDGRLPFSEVLFSGPKKSGKTTVAQWCGLYVIVALAGRYGEAVVAANDFEQAQSRVFQGMARIIEASPLLKRIARLRSNTIEFPSTGSTIRAIASDYASAAGANQNIAIFDELGATPWSAASACGTSLSPRQRERSPPV